MSIEKNQNSVVDAFEETFTLACDFSLYQTEVLSLRYLCRTKKHLNGY